MVLFEGQVIKSHMIWGRLLPWWYWYGAVDWIKQRSTYGPSYCVRYSTVPSGSLWISAAIRYMIIKWPTGMSLFSEAQCDSWNVIGSHNHIGSGTIRSCIFVGVGMALLEEVCHCEDGLWGFVCSEYHLNVTVEFLLPAGCSTPSSSTTSACMPPCFPSWW